MSNRYIKGALTFISLAIFLSAATSLELDQASCSNDQISNV